MSGFSGHAEICQASRAIWMLTPLQMGSVLQIGLPGCPFLNGHYWVYMVYKQLIILGSPVAYHHWLWFIPWDSNGIPYSLSSLFLIKLLYLHREAGQSPFLDTAIALDVSLATSRTSPCRWLCKMSSISFQGDSCLSSGNSDPQERVFPYNVGIAMS